MKAARYYGPGDIRIEDIKERELKPGYVKISPAYVGICGTDLHEYLGGPAFAPKDPHPISGECIPITIGHEFSGTVVEVGEGVTDIEKGQNVAVQPNLYCDQCVACKLGSRNVCNDAGFYGLSGGDGGMADFAVLPRRALHKLPDNVPLEIGALVEPLAVGMHAVNASNFQPGSTALILGSGPIGLAILLALKSRHARMVIMAEVSSQRQQFAKQFGADFVIDPSNEDVVQKTKELCSAPMDASGYKGTGADVVFDCAGNAKTLQAATTAVRKLGTVINVAIWEKETEFKVNNMVFSEAYFKGVLGYLAEDFEKVIEALRQGSIEPGGMITKRIKLDDLVKEGYQTLIDDKDNHVKILIDLKAK